MRVGGSRRDIIRSTVTVDDSGLAVDRSALRVVGAGVPAGAALRAGATGGFGRIDSGLAGLVAHDERIIRLDTPKTLDGLRFDSLKIVPDGDTWLGFGRCTSL
jgi:hypothetical protein